MKSPKILVIDIETTGFSSSRAKIVEIGIVELNLDNGNTEILFDELVLDGDVTEEVISTSWIVENSDLKAEDVMNAGTLKFYEKRIQDIFDRYPLGATAFNREFDFRFLRAREFELPVSLPCPMILSTPICKLPGKHSGYKWPKVEEAYEFFFPNSDYVEAHRGADDAIHEAQIVFELYKRGHFKI